MSLELRVNALKVEQNEKFFYLFKIEAKNLLHISYFNSREIDRESGIQRPFKDSRSKEIAEYLESDDAVLANNIIISLNSEYISYENGVLSIDKAKNVAFVIDGQHRLRSFNYTKRDMELPVSAFVDLSLAEIAEIFVKINYYQKPVNKSLVYDLLGISTDIFPQYIEAHKITQALNDAINSPWFGMIKMLGIGSGIITQATFITALEKYKILDNVLSEYDTSEKVYILSNYFEAVKKHYPKEWGTKGSILTKSLGFHAFTKVFPKVFRSVASNTNDFKVNDIISYLTPIANINFQSEDIASLGGMKGVNRLANIIEKALEKSNGQN